MLVTVRPESLFPLTTTLYMASFVVNRQAVDFQTAEVMLHDAEDTLNKVEDCSRLPPALDILAFLSKQHPAAWQARFGVLFSGTMDLF